MEAIKYLDQVKRLDRQVEKCRNKERELRALLESTTQVSNGMPHGSGNPDKITNTMQKLIEAQKRTNSAIDKYVNAKQDVIEHIKVLPERQYEVLLWLFIRKKDKRKPGQDWYYSWSEVAGKMRCSEQNVSKLRRKAINNLQKILDPEGENAKK